MALGLHAKLLQMYVMIVILCHSVVLWLIPSRADLYGVNSTAARVRGRLCTLLLQRASSGAPILHLNVLFLISFGRVKWGVSCSLSEQ